MLARTPSKASNPAFEVGAERGLTFCGADRVQGVNGGSLALRALTAGDLDEVKGLLIDLPLDYPGGDRWLDRRLREVLGGEATCELAILGGRLTGLTIGTPKTRATKLSTIYVAPIARRLRVGTALLDSFIAQTTADLGILNRRRGATCGRTGDEIYVTAAHHRWPDLRPLFESRGFIVTAQDSDRYGPGRHEGVATRVAG